MRSQISVMAIAIASLASACGSTEVDAPAAPSSVPAPAPAPGPAPTPAPSFPDLAGRWIGSGITEYTNSPQGVRNGFPCERGLFVDNQSEGTFSGRIDWKGGGSSSDGHCTHGGTYTGRLDADGTLTLTLDQEPRTRDCTRISGTNVFTGTFTGERLEGQMTDRVSCLDLIGRRFEADRTFTFSVRRGPS